MKPIQGKHLLLSFTFEGCEYSPEFRWSALCPGVAPMGFGSDMVTNMLSTCCEKNIPIYGSRMEYLLLYLHIYIYI